MLPVNEIFVSVQGEGAYKIPSVFIRLFGCNLRCMFNGESCDTPYAVISGEKELMSIEQIIKRVKKFKVKGIVITGGEPLLYTFELERLVTELTKFGYFIQIETNGTIIPSDFLLANVDVFNVSVKLKSSNQPKNFEKTRINKEAIKKFSSHNHLAISFFKFVVTSKTDLKEIKELEKIIGRKDTIMLMPQGETREEVIDNTPFVWDMCIENDYIFTSRDHIVAFGKRRKI